MRLLASTGSTNTEAAAAARSGAAAGTVVAADHQAAGRGRLDRRWDSPPSSGLLFSVVVRPAGLPARAWSWLPLLTGVAVAAAVRAETAVDVGLKWPNDLVVEQDGQQRKLGGILCEALPAPEPEAVAAVLGVGINVDLRADELPVPAATSLVLAGASPLPREQLLAAAVASLLTAYEQWAAHDFDAQASGLHDEYLAACRTLGVLVEVSRPAAPPLRGRAVGLDRDGSLLVDSAGSTVVVAAGDVVHLRAD